MSSPKLGKDIIVRDLRVILPDKDITVTAGIVCLLIHIPARKEHQGSFNQALDVYHNKV